MWGVELAWGSNCREASNKFRVAEGGSHLREARAWGKRTLCPLRVNKLSHMLNLAE